MIWDSNTESTPKILQSIRWLVASIWLLVMGIFFLLIFIATAKAQEIPPLVRTIGGADSTFKLIGAAGTDSIYYRFPRVTTGSYPVVNGNLSVAFKQDSLGGVTDSLTVWMKTLRRVGTALVICENDSFNLFNQLDWKNGGYYCWPDQNSTPISYGPCDGVLIIWKHTGAAADSSKTTPYVTVQ